EAMDLLEMANQDYEKAVEAHDKMAAKGDPLLTYVGAYSKDGNVYRAEYWDPHELLDYIDQKIPALKQVLLQAADERQHARWNFMGAEHDATGDLNNLQDGILNSAGLQFGVEMGFTIYEVCKKFSEGGLPGALAEGAKTLVEELLKPPTFA